MTIAMAAPGSGWLDKSSTVAKSGFNRWLVPPAALAIHLCIGMAYGFSVFWIPLSRSIGITKSVACPADMSLVQALFVTGCDWKISDLGRLAGTRRPAQGGLRLRAVLVRRPLYLGDRRLHPPALADVAGLRRDR